MYTNATAVINYYYYYCYGFGILENASVVFVDLAKRPNQLFLFFFFVCLFFQICILWYRYVILLNFVLSSNVCTMNTALAGCHSVPLRARLWP